MASPPVIADPAQASRRAKIRIGVAITLLVTAVGILAVLNNQHKPAPQDIAGESLPPAQTSISSQETEKPAEPETPQISSVTSPPAPAMPEAEPPPPPPTPGKLPVAPVIKAPPAVAAPAEKTGGHIVSEKPPTPGAPPKPTPEPVAPKTPAIPAVTASEPAKTTAPKEFEVQLGVFSDMENAKQLQAKLAEHGIPSHTETRVQVGPFKNRAEADQAREKLKALGITAVIAPK